MSQNAATNANSFPSGLENAPISPADKEKIAHGNAEKVLKLAPR